ncbi:E3 SUMO-protein ligase PIAS3-like [Ochotona curzoniae]|uniref:E3 SUMO-protein ligase PIAS3-like n=1 Tax=Ochotona curzoniae TaxID=130825 RepID=UPI001B352A79|nr:E3 SUMO-protein ligase PIAS3-like [Ochotona curzoniae]
MAELGELKHMVMSFRVSELQVLLGFAGRNKSGRKHELLAKALHLLKSSCAPSVQMKIKELYRRRFPRKTLGPSDLSLLSLPPGTPPVGSPVPLTPMPPALLTPGTLLGPKREVDMHPLLPQPVHPDVTMKPLPFYEVHGELIRPTTLASTSTQRFEEVHFTFALMPQFFYIRARIQGFGSSSPAFPCCLRPLIEKATDLVQLHDRVTACLAF